MQFTNNTLIQGGGLSRCEIIQFEKVSFVIGTVTWKAM